MTVSRRENVPPRWGLAEAGVGVLAALILMWILISWLRSTPYYDGHVVLVLSYAVVWVPFVAAVVVAVSVRGSGRSAYDLGLSITLLDIFFGVGVGLLARAVAGIIEIAFTGRMVGLGVTFGETVYDGWWLFGTILAPVLIGPVIEEIYFRGLLQRAVLRFSSVKLGKKTATGVAIGVSSLLFASLHVVQAASPTAALILGLSSLIFGLGVGLLAALTGRVGGAILAHIIFNGSLVLTSLSSMP